MLQRGHSSALAAIETVRRYGKENVILLNHDICPRTEDEDIKRFKREVAEYLGLGVTYANMPGWQEKDQFDICMDIGAFKYGVQSTALCTRKIKTEPFERWLSAHYPPEHGKLRDDVAIVYGFDHNETTRITRRVGALAAMGFRTEFPLVWDERTIYNTEDIGIKRPYTYEIFNHANCRGCLKAGKQHWYIVYCLYPDIWEKAKSAEEVIGYSILKSGFLYEYEEEFAKLKHKMLVPTEKVKPQSFWAAARKLIAEDDVLPCECAE